MRIDPLYETVLRLLETDRATFKYFILVLRTYVAKYSQAIWAHIFPNSDYSSYSEEGAN